MDHASQMQWTFLKQQTEKKILYSCITTGFAIMNDEPDFKTENTIHKKNKLLKI